MRNVKEVEDFIKDAYNDFMEDGRSAGCWYLNTSYRNEPTLVMGYSGNDLCLKIAYRCNYMITDYDYDWATPKGCELFETSLDENEDNKSLHLLARVFTKELNSILRDFEKGRLIFDSEPLVIYYTLDNLEIKLIRSNISLFKKELANALSNVEIKIIPRDIVIKGNEISIKCRDKYTYNKVKKSISRATDTAISWVDLYSNI